MGKVMKKYLSVMIAAMCILSLIGGCGSKETNKEETKKEETKKEETKKEETEKEGTESGAKDNAAISNAADYVTLGEYKGIEISANSYEVTDESLKQYVNEMLAGYPSYKATDKTTVEKGDVADINYEGIKDGKPFEGGTAENYKLEIGSNSFIPGFEDGLIGAKVGEERAVDLTFPEDYQSEDLAGQAVVFNVKINSIVEKETITYDTLTDDYVKTNFGSEDVKAFLDSAKTQLEQNNEYSKQTDVQNLVSEKLKSSSKVKEVPDTLVDEKVNEYLEQFAYMCKSQYDMEMKEYLETNYQMTEEDFKAETYKFIEESLDLELILEAIAVKEEIKVDEEGFTNFKNSLMSSYGIENEEGLLKQFSKEYLEQKYLENKAMEFVRENAKITYQEEAAAADDKTSEQETTNEAVNAEGAK